MKRSEIVSALRKFREMNTLRYGIIRMGLFGSAARDDMHEKSDIDVVVELEEPDMFNLVGIKQDLEDQLHLSVDVVRYRGRMNEFLKRRIDEEAVYV
ncbi:MAG TPA: nucleotidyltransferase domain-containing protein [Thermodesulfobacteriota bacterium]|nr:nucleotidyltransferase domain-containing protein [Deltaproteobacteria bacterium]HNR12797.1 nucleotidyltransferase domain-containing protein [Thermodesulfobacteriota bacterium]HNU70349.1 nucleotidyltransferase domain-containing protein [Thermodesulfobacteriota bacterium]HQO78176.1 nucleotidyltransferase domain-containing protein [Thermodesulfobacteriota bacterium]